MIQSNKRCIERGRERDKLIRVSKRSGVRDKKRNIYVIYICFSDAVALDGPDNKNPYKSTRNANERSVIKTMA